MFERLRSWFSPPQMDPVRWRLGLQRLPLARRIPAAQRGALRALTARFLAEKHFEPASGLELTRDMRELIALQACLPVCAMGYGGLRGWSTVIVYPGRFRVRHEHVDPAGVHSSGAEELSGEAWLGGPLVLSWEDVLRGAEQPDDGENVVFHEVAHKLDMQNGAANGMPPLPTAMRPEPWTAAMTAAFADLQRKVNARRPPLDPYAAHSPAECFAVLTEYFLEDPVLLHRLYPAVYEQFRLFYALDPLRWRS